MPRSAARSGRATPGPGPLLRTRASPPAVPEAETLVAWSCSSSLAPDVARELDHEAELSLLHLRRRRIASVDAGKAALRTDGEAVEIEGTRRLLDALLERILALHLGRLGRDNAEHHDLVPWNEAQRRERTGARRVVFEEIELDVERVEQPLGHVVVASFRVPLAAAIAAAKMHADPHALRRILEHAVGDGDVLVDQRAPVVAAGLQRGLYFGVAELGKGGLVDLHIAAAGLGKRLQLLAERLHGVVPELVEVLVGGGEHGSVAAAEMQRTGAGDRDLGNKLGAGRNESEVRHVDRPRPLHTALDQRDRLGGALAGRTGLGAALGIFAADRIDAEVAELAVEEAVIGAAAEFAIGGQPEADTLLERENVLDRAVFGGGQLLGTELATHKTRTGLEQP